MVREPTPGRTAENMSDNLRMVKHMVRELSPGRVEKNMSGNTRMAK